MNVVWRQMAEADLDDVLAVAAVVHPDYPEDRAVFAERLALYPAGCLIAERDGRPVGYAVLHPGRLGVPPPLDSPLGALPADADCLYLHDVALLPDTRGLGLGEGALRHARALAVAAGYPLLALTSTPPARGYWERLGFAEYRDGGPVLAAKLTSYGGGMTYMVLPSDGAR